jgi:predicted PurR-regulated permease PerM
MPNNSKTNVKPRSIYAYVILGAALFAFIQTFLLLSPILLSFLLILLIALALNPVISRMRAFTGGRKGAMALIVVALVAFIALTSWAFFGRTKDSVTKLSEQLPAYWERLQKPLITMEQKAVRSEEKLQAEVSTEFAQTATEEGKPAAARRTSKPAPPQPTKDSESIRSKLSQMLQGRSAVSQQ